MAYNNIKAEHAFQSFSRDLKEGDFPQVIFMHGEEDYLIRWACKELAGKFVDKYSFDVDFLRMVELENVDELLEACNTFSIFSSRRIVWADDFPPLLKKNAKGFGQEQINKLRAYIADPNPGTILVLSCGAADGSNALVKELKKNCRCYDFSKLDRPQLASFAKKRLRAAGAQISPQTLQYFIDETGYFHKDTDYRLYNLINDIEKLVAYCGGQTITEEAVDATLKGDLEKFAFDFLDALTSGRKDRAFSLFHNIVGSGEDIYSVLGLVISQFELMLQARELREEGLAGDKIASVLKANAYRVKKALAIAERTSADKLRRTLSELYETDRRIKTGEMDGAVSLELIIGRT